jgi:hypothetical protein
MDTESKMIAPIWAIKRYEHEEESPVEPTGYPGYDHAIWYWWDARIGNNIYNQATWDAVLDRITHHNKILTQSPYTKIDWERLNEGTWRVIAIAGGNRTVLATLRKVSRIANPESTYRWYKE